MYKRRFIKKIGLLLCSGLIICTFINAKAAMPKTCTTLSYINNNESVSDCNKMNDIELYNTEIYDIKLYDNELYNNILFQQNTEKMYEQDISFISAEKKKKIKTIGGLIVKKREKIRVSKKEKNILYRIVEAEAGGENMSGKMLVANVIINRYLNNSFPDSIKGVVFARSDNTYQFSPIRDGRYFAVNVSKQTKEAVNNALDGLDNSKGALYFMCRSKAQKDNVTWFDKSLDYVLEYGGHEFFK